MRIGASPALPDDPTERTAIDRTKPQPFRAALRTAAKRRDDQDDAAAGQAAQQQAQPAEPAQKTAGAAAPTSEHTNDTTAETAIDRTARPTSGEELDTGSTVTASSGDRTVAPAAEVARATKDAANGVEVMAAGSAESASRTALTASIAATLAFATGDAPRGQAVAATPTKPAAQPATQIQAPTRTQAPTQIQATQPQATAQAKHATAQQDQAIDPMLAAMLGLGAPPVVAAPTAPAPTPAAKGDPVSALLAAAVSRAVGSFATAASPAAAPEAAPAAAPTLPTGLDQILNLTPLEQAVHELIGKMTDHKSDAPDGKTTASDADLAPFHALASAHLASHGAEPVALAPSAAGPVRAAAPIATPELPVDPNPGHNPSHVHLIVDDGPERVVVTVAMRGNDVRVAMRSADDTTTTALARNAASLDHAMRARGLQLGELTAEREPTERRQQRPARDPEPRERKDTPKFSLEEIKP